MISATELSSTSPEFGTDGAYGKCWQRENGAIYLYKSGSDTHEIEPLSEALATQLADILCPHAVRYALLRYHGRPASKCALFTDEQHGLAKASALPIENRRSPAALLAYTAQLGDEDAMRRMFLLDALALNIDRHLGNVGFLYDNNRSLLFQFNDDQLTQHLDWCIRQCQPRLGGDFIKTAQAVLTDELWQELKNLVGFRFTPPAAFPSESPRLPLLSEAVNHQLRAILQ